MNLLPSAPPEYFPAADFSLPRAENNTIINIRNFGPFMVEERLKAMFAKFGTISSYQIMNKEKPWDRFAYIAFKDYDSAAEAVIEMNGQKLDLDGRRIEVRKSAYSERPKEPRRRNPPTVEIVYESQLNEQRRRSVEETGTNLMRNNANDRTNTPTNSINRTAPFIPDKRVIYIKGFQDYVTATDLEAFFIQFGPIVAVKVFKANPQEGRYGKNFGFVTFSHEETTQFAIRCTHGTPGLGADRLEVYVSLGPKHLRGLNVQQDQQRNYPPKMLPRPFSKIR